MHPGTYTVRLTVDGAAQEKPIEIRMDPRVKISTDDLRRHTDASLACYRAYLDLQRVRDAIDAKPPAERAALVALRGEGEPEDQDVLYGNITSVPADRETIVGLQEKFLFMLTVLQSADARPTPQALAAIGELQKTAEILKSRVR